MVAYKWNARIIDVETSCLHGGLKEEIFMETPSGMKAWQDENV
jgi:hypothetical protein